MRTPARLCSMVALSAMLFVGGPAAATAAAQGGLGAAPELTAVGSGRAEGRCFIEIHFDRGWPPPTDIQEWVLAVTAQGTGGAISIRNFFSIAQGRSGLSATGPQGDFVVDALLLDDDVTAFEWSCTAAPATVEVLLEYGDGNGTTLLADRLASTAFDDVPRDAGDVPEAELTVDETADLLPPEEGGGADPTDEPTGGGGGGMGAGGALAIVLGVAALGAVGYFAMSSRGGADEAAQGDGSSTDG